MPEDVQIELGPKFSEWTDIGNSLGGNEDVGIYNTRKITAFWDPIQGNSAPVYVGEVDTLMTIYHPNVHLQMDPDYRPPGGNTILYDSGDGSLTPFGISGVFYGSTLENRTPCNGVDACWENCWMGCTHDTLGGDGIPFTEDDSWYDCPCDGNLDIGGEGTCDNNSYSTACYDHSAFWMPGEVQCEDVEGVYGSPDGRYRITPPQAEPDNNPTINPLPDIPR